MNNLLISGEIDLQWWGLLVSGAIQLHYHIEPDPTVSPTLHDGSCLFWRHRLKTGFKLTSECITCICNREGGHSRDVSYWTVPICQTNPHVNYCTDHLNCEVHVHVVSTKVPKPELLQDLVSIYRSSCAYKVFPPDLNWTQRWTQRWTWIHHKNLTAALSSGLTSPAQGGIQSSLGKCSHDTMSDYWATTSDETQQFLGVKLE